MSTKQKMCMVEGCFRYVALNEDFCNSCKDESTKLLAHLSTPPDRVVRPPNMTCPDCRGWKDWDMQKCVDCWAKKVELASPFIVPAPLAYAGLDGAKPCAGCQKVLLSEPAESIYCKTCQDQAWLIPPTTTGTVVGYCDICNKTFDISQSCGVRHTNAQQKKPEENILQEADRLTSGDRRKQYGHPRDQFGRLAKLWSVVLGVEITPMQVALCLIQLKVSRQMNGHHRDSLVDIAGYARTAEMLEDADYQ